MKIAYIMLTNGLECDDRIRKEMFSMRELLGEVEFKIFGFHGDNHAETGVLSYGVPYELVSLKNRGGKKGVIDELRKEYDLYSQIRPKVKDYDLLWICDDQPFFFPLLSKKPVIFDLHEIPLLWGTWAKNTVFHRMERRSRWLLHANQERLDFLVEQGVVKKPSKNLILRNYPDKSWLAEGSKEPMSFNKFKAWLGEDEYIYVQGINSPSRYPWETLSAIMEAHCMKTAVIGSVPEEIKKRIKEDYPDSDKYIYYTGQLVQSDTAAFIANCKFSIVFYKNEAPNDRYCEPNRLFQSLAFGKPAMVGCNPTMASVISHYGNGIVLKTDGGVIADSVEGIRTMLQQYASLKESAEEYKGHFSWEAQKDVFAKLFGRSV